MKICLWCGELMKKRSTIAESEKNVGIIAETSVPPNRRDTHKIPPRRTIENAGDPIGVAAIASSNPQKTRANTNMEAWKSIRQGNEKGAFPAYSLSHSPSRVTSFPPLILRNNWYPAVHILTSVLQAIPLLPAYRPSAKISM